MADKNIRLECEVGLSRGVRLNDWNEYYTKRDTDALLARKQDNLSEEEMAAVGSGITSDKLENIETAVTEFREVGAKFLLIDVGDIDELNTEQINEIINQHYSGFIFGDSEYAYLIRLEESRIDFAWMDGETLYVKTAFYFKDSNNEWQPDSVQRAHLISYENINDCLTNRAVVLDLNIETVWDFNKTIFYNILNADPKPQIIQLRIGTTFLTEIIYNNEHVPVGILLIGCENQDERALKCYHIWNGPSGIQIDSASYLTWDDMPNYTQLYRHTITFDYEEMVFGDDYDEAVQPIYIISHSSSPITLNELNNWPTVGKEIVSCGDDSGHFIGSIGYDGGNDCIQINSYSKTQFITFTTITNFRDYVTRLED